MVKNSELNWAIYPTAQNSRAFKERFIKIVSPHDSHGWTLDLKRATESLFQDRLDVRHRRYFYSLCNPFANRGRAAGRKYQVRKALREYGKLDVYANASSLTIKKYSAAAEGDSELLRSGSGVAGARILSAYQAMAGANPPIPITPAKLATRTVTGYPTALRWIKIHHPELLVPKPDEPDEVSVAPVAVAPAPPVVATVQKQPDPAPKKRVTVKANASKLPKPLRNPKSHPELLAPHLDVATIYPKTDPETAGSPKGII
jgi:hypothetical protein